MHSYHGVAKITSVDIVTVPEGMHCSEGDLTSLLNANNDSAAKINN